MARLENQLRGAHNKRTGEVFERLILQACNYYSMKGIAEIDKTPEPMRVCGSLGGGRFAAFFEKQAQPDFKGTLHTGRAVLFEAKNTDSDRIEQSRVTPEQTRVLERHHKIGAVCFVLVSFGLQTFYRVPWEVWRDMKKHSGYKYLKQRDLCGCEIPNVYGCIRFLKGMEK